MKTDFVDDMKEFWQARNGQLVQYREQDVEPYLEANKRAMLDFGTKQRKSSFRHVAEVPNVIVEKWLRELGVNIFDRNHAKKVQQLLNSSEYRYLRTSPGKLKIRV